MDQQAIIERLNQNAPGFISMLGGKVIEIDREARSCTFEFNVSRDYCHSVDIVQGGFVTAMLDAAMSHAVFAVEENIVNVSSLEIATRYLEPTRAGRLRAVGKISKASYKTAFLDGALYDENGLLTATTHSVAKLIRGK